MPSSSFHRSYGPLYPPSPRLMSKNGTSAGACVTAIRFHSSNSAQTTTPGRGLYWLPGAVSMEQRVILRRSAERSTGPSVRREVLRCAQDDKTSDLLVDLSAGLPELASLLLETDLDRHVLVEPVCPSVLAHVLGDAHAAEMGATHRAEMGHLRRVGRQRLIVVRDRRLGIEREVELVLPAELEPRLGERVVSQIGAGMALGQVSRVGRDLVRDNAVFHVLTIGQTQVLCRGDVA